MHLSTREQSALARIFALLADDHDEREIRLRLGQAMLELLQADQFASFVWDEATQRFGHGLWLNMDDANLARYDAWYQHRDPITFALQARRHATAVSEVMPHRELRRTEFFNDFLARDGLHWGINLHAFDGDRALGDLRIWRGRRRREFEPRDKALLGLVEPAFIAALRRARDRHLLRTARGDDGSVAALHPAPAPRASPDRDAVPTTDRAKPVTSTSADASGPASADTRTIERLSPREREVALAVLRGLTDKQIARELGLSPSSVRTYLNRLFEKTGAVRRAGLARWAATLARDGTAH